VNAPRRIFNEKEISLVSRSKIAQGREGRIQRQFLEDREGWSRRHSAETGAGSDPTKGGIGSVGPDLRAGRSKKADS